MSGDDGRRTFKRCRSAINVHDPILTKIAQEIDFAEMLLLEYLKEVTPRARSPREDVAMDHMSRLVLKEIEYLKKVRDSEVVKIDENLVTFRGEDGEFLVTVVPEEELQRNFHPLLCFKDVKPRFAKPVSSCEKLAAPSSSTESVYYDACTDWPMPELPSESSAFGRTIYGMLNYIFTSTIGRMENTDP